MKQQTPRSQTKKKEMSEWEVEELVRQQTREFKREIEKRYALSKHNQVFSFPLDPSTYSNDSSLASLDTAEVYNLHHQNNLLGLRKKSMSEKLIRGLDIDRNTQPKSQERQRRNETSAERIALTNRPIALTLAPSTKKPTKSEHQAESPYQAHSQRHQPVLFKMAGQSGSHTPLGNTQRVEFPKSQVDFNKSTQMIQQKIQRIIQDSIVKQSERTSTAASLHQGLAQRMAADQSPNTNSTLLKLLQKNGMLKPEVKEVLTDKQAYVATNPLNPMQHQQSAKQIKPLCTTNRQISLRQLKSPSCNSKSYFSRNNVTVTKQDTSMNQSFNRTHTQHDSNNTSRTYISNLPHRQQSGQKYTACNTSRAKDTPFSPTIATGNKSFQENSYVYSNVARFPTQHAEVIQNYIQIDNYLNQTRSYQSNNNAARQNHDRIKDHMIKIGCITGRNLNSDRNMTLHSQIGSKLYPKYQINQNDSQSKTNYSMGY